MNQGQIPLLGLAFLQNMWVKDPQRVKEIINRHDESFRVAFIKRLLFNGCLSGRRLKTAFTDRLINSIVWEEITREIGGTSNSAFQADHKHIENAIFNYNPKVILTFGCIAETAIEKCWEGLIIKAPHPAARQSDVVLKLEKAAQEFQIICRASQK